MEDLVDHLFG